MQLQSIDANGVRLAYVEWGAPSADWPTVYFVHATGFHSRVWDYQVEALLAQLPDLHIVCLDQRGHGRSEKIGTNTWATYGADQAAFAQAIDLDGAIGVGHSMGAHGLIQGAQVSGRFDRLLLLDPTVSSPEAYAEGGSWPDGEIHPASKRRANFQSVEEMKAALAEKSSFPLYHPRIFDDYCRHGLEPAEEGLTLCCKPEIEAMVYMAARGHGAIYDYVRALDIPVTVVRAKLPGADAMMDWSSSPTWPELAGQFAQGRDVHWSDCTHFIPMQRPDEVVAMLVEEVNAWRALRS